MKIINGASTLPPQLVVIGDSNNKAPVTPPGNTWVDQARVGELVGWNIVEQTVNGQSMADTLANYTANVAPLYDQKRAKNVLVLFSSAIGLTARREIIDTATVAGWFVITNTIAGNQYMSDGIRLAENASIRGVVGHENLADIAAPHCKFGTLAEAADTTWFYDGAHVTPAGAKGYKDIIVPKILNAPNSLESAFLRGNTYVLTFPALESIGAIFHAKQITCT